MSEQMVTASCLCGGVVIEVTLPSLWCAHCHCGQCRKAHGAGCVTWVGVADEQVRIRDEQQLLNWYQSSEQAQRAHCGRCGSGLMFRSSRWPGETHIVLGAFDAPIDRKPAAHVFFETHVDWMTVDPDLPVYKPGGN